MKELAQLLNDMCSRGVLTNYAVFGAVAQLRYTEPVATLDADVLVAIPGATGLDVLGGIYRFCAKRGWQPEGEAIRVGAWPVQFIPAFSPLTLEALENAETADLDGVPFRVVTPDYLAVIALSVGRAKDYTRILALLESGSTNSRRIDALAARHELDSSWNKFKSRFLSE